MGKLGLKKFSIVKSISILSKQDKTQIDSSKAYSEEIRPDCKHQN